jgi:hypothetical protein
MLYLLGCDTFITLVEVLRFSAIFEQLRHCIRPSGDKSSSRNHWAKGLQVPKRAGEPDKSRAFILAKNRESGLMCSSPDSSDLTRDSCNPDSSYLKVFWLQGHVIPSKSKRAAPRIYEAHLPVLVRKIFKTLDRKNLGLSMRSFSADGARGGVHSVQTQARKPLDMSAAWTSWCKCRLSFVRSTPVFLSVGALDQSPLAPFDANKKIGSIQPLASFT